MEHSDLNLRASRKKKPQTLISENYNFQILDSIIFPFLLLIMF